MDGRVVRDHASCCGVNLAVAAVEVWFFPQAVVEAEFFRNAVAGLGFFRKPL
jgi:hypothetical protein